MLFYRDMISSRTPWGIAFPIVAAVISGGAFWIVATSTNLAHPFYTVFVPWAGLVLSVVSFLVGHVSYPRIHNLKVFMAGYVIGLCSLGYFLVCAPPPGIEISIRPGYGDTVLLMLLLNLVAITLIPSFVKYQFTKLITWTVVGIEAVVLVLADTVPAFQKVELAGNLGWLGPVLGAAIIALTVKFVRREFHLGGLIAGTAVFYGTVWALPVDPTQRSAYEPFMFALGLVYLEIGAVVHWFARLEHRIAYDPLLHIYNRDYCSRILNEQSKLNTSPLFTIAMVDIDHFKKVNDTYGHQAGDQVLHAVAQTISRVVVPAGTFCRYGGEELAAFFPQKSTAEVKSIMEEARKAVEKARVVSGKKTIAVTVSSGISTRTESAQTLADVMAAADKALYRAKQGGRNQVRTGTTKSYKKA